MSAKCYIPLHSKVNLNLLFLLSPVQSHPDLSAAALVAELFFMQLDLLLLTLTN